MNNSPTLETPTAPASLPETAEEQLTELRSVVGEIRGAWTGLSALPAEVKALKEGASQFAGELRELRRNLLSRPGLAGPRPRGQVSEGCARHMAAQFIVQCERSDKLEALASVPAQRDALVGFARSTLNLSTRTALTASDINLPSQYGGEIRELISE